MAMPPGGGSSWYHAADSYQLLADGALWGSVDVPVARDRLTFTMPYTGTIYDAYLVLELAPRGGGVRLTLHHPLLPSPRRVTWTAASDPAALLPHRELRARGRWDGHVADAPLVAALHASPGALAVHDAAGRPRLHVRLGEADLAWPPGPRGELLDGGAAVASFCLPTGPGLEVRVVATSPP